MPASDACSRHTPRPFRLVLVLMLAGSAILPLIRANGSEPAVASPPKAGDIRTDPKLGGELVYIPSGEFWMGADNEELDRIWKERGWPDKDKPLPAGEEGPNHKVKITSGFWMGRTEVTVAQFRKFCQDTERPMPEQSIFWSKNEDWPVTNVSWDQAQAYCKWAGARLSTEAEWEYVAAAGRTGVDPNMPDKCDDAKRALFFWGNDLPTDPIGNLGDVSAANTTKRPQQVFATGLGEYNDKFGEHAPVGSFPPNAFKVFDMEGNVSEWCSDLYSSSYYKRSRPADPKGPSELSDFDMPARRVIRGPSWVSARPYQARMTARRSMEPEKASMIIGFRVVVDQPPIQ